MGVTLGGGDPAQGGLRVPKTPLFLILRLSSEAVWGLGQGWPSTGRGQRLAEGTESCLLGRG
jgi:hypothetical protein